jgi:hypothetical protein
VLELLCGPQALKIMIIGTYKLVGGGKGGFYILK